VTFAPGASDAASSGAAGSCAATDPVADATASEPAPKRLLPDRWWPIAWYPIAFPVAYIIAIWSASAIHPSWLLRPILVAVAVVLLLTLVLSAALRDRHRGGLAASTLMLALLLTDERVRAALLVLTVLIIGDALINRGRRWRFGSRVTRFMSILGAALILVVVLSTIQQGTFQEAVADIQADLDARHAEAFDAAAPDIYMILLDAYPGDDAATLDPTFDADAFPSALEARGFEVERHARSNYLTTRLTVPTMLADQHVEAASELDPPFGNQAADARRLREFGDEGIVLRTLRDAGYETFTVPSPAAHLGLRRVDRVIDPPGASEFELVLLRTTWLGAALDRLMPDFFASGARAQVLANYASAEAVAAEEHSRPRFVWVHILAPHGPIVFRADGSPIVGAEAFNTAFKDPAGSANATDRIDATFSYADFVADRTIELVDRIVASTKREAVVVVFSDHGTDIRFNAADPLASDLNERSSVVLAIRSPGRSGLLPAGTTPIGVLPRVLNAYLGTSLPIRSDTLWGWPRDGSLLDAVPLDLKALRP
jgi:hypothetical protein